MWDNLYFQMDIYKSPCHSRCDGLVLLETYSTMPSEQVIAHLPPFLPLIKDVTGNPEYSMYNLSRKEDWTALSSSSANTSTSLIKETQSERLVSPSIIADGLLDDPTRRRSSAANRILSPLEKSMMADVSSKAH